MEEEVISQPSSALSNAEGGENASKNAKSSAHYLSAIIEDCSLQNYELSQPLGKIFLEEERGFRAIESNNLNCSSQPSKQCEICPYDIASKAENSFHAFSKYCFGLLSGIALWQCVIVYQLSPPHFEVTDFVKHYGFLSQPLQILFYFLCTVSTVSALDRLYTSSINLCIIKEILMYKTGILVAALYPLCLLFSLSISNIDEMFSYYRYRAPVLNVSEIQVLNDEFEYWRSMNTARSLCVVFGWTAIVIQGNEYS